MNQNKPEQENQKNAQKQQQNFQLSDENQDRKKGAQDAELSRAGAREGQSPSETRMTGATSSQAEERKVGVGADIDKNKEPDKQFTSSQSQQPGSQDKWAQRGQDQVSQSSQQTRQ